ncbi:ras-related protein Rab-34-like [Stegodyphus dumicola]|nr:ras-related protein Rab-34-like [Stegodyphus dumicola]
MFRNNNERTLEQPPFHVMALPKTVEQRTIDKLPLAYDYNCTPYKEREIPLQLYNVCNQINSNKHEMVRLTKVIVVGDVAVGKTCLVSRFCLQAFDTSYKATIGVDFAAEKFYILDVPYILQIWDTAGQEKFKCIASSYYRGARVVILVFDFSHISSLYNILNWLNETSKCNEKPLLFLVGTKKDIVTKSVYKLTEDEAVKLANTINAEYWPVSSKTGENVEQLFHRIAALTFTEYILKESEHKETIRISDTFVKLSKTSPKKKKPKCMPACN